MQTRAAVAVGTDVLQPHDRLRGRGDAERLGSGLSHEEVEEVDGGRGPSLTERLGALEMQASRLEQVTALRVRSIRTLPVQGPVRSHRTSEWVQFLNVKYASHRGNYRVEWVLEQAVFLGVCVCTYGSQSM